MNLRQTQRALAEVLTRCQEAHVELPVDVFEGMLSAGEALRHSRVGGKFHVDDAVDEMKQRYGLVAKYKQLEVATVARKQSQQKRRRLHRADEPRTDRSEHAKPSDRQAATDSAASNQSGSDTDREASAKKPRSTRQTRIQRIIENNPAKNPANEELAEEFVELGGFELEHGETQKGISRMSVAKQIRMAEEPITSGAQARKLPRVGPSAAAKIDEILHRGKMKVLEQYEAESEGSVASNEMAKQRQGDKPGSDESAEDLDEEEEEDEEEQDDPKKDEDWHEESE